MALGSGLRIEVAKRNSMESRKSEGRPGKVDHAVVNRISASTDLASWDEAFGVLAFWGFG